MSASDEYMTVAAPKKYQGDIKTTVHFTSDYVKECTKAGLKPDGEIEACSVSGGGRSEIIIQNPCKKRGPYPRLLCHELSHLNGWSANHEK